MFAVSLTIYKILANQIKCQKFYLEPEEEEIWSSPFDQKYSILYRWILRMLAKRQHTFTQKDTHTHTHTYTAREVLTKGKICAVDLL